MKVSSTTGKSRSKGTPRSKKARKKADENVMGLAPLECNDLGDFSEIHDSSDPVQNPLLEPKVKKPKSPRYYIILI